MTDASETPRHVFTYGSLMFERVWRRVVRGHYVSEPAEIRGFKRFAVRGQDYPAVIATRREHRLAGVLYRDVRPDDLARLDRFESDDYVRLRVPAFLTSGAFVLADVYVATPAIDLSPDEWNPEAFRREGIERFEARYMAEPDRLDPQA